MSSIQNFKILSQQVRFLKTLAQFVRRAVRKRVTRQLIHFVTHGHVIKYLRIKSFLNLTSTRYLQVGGGKHLKPGPCWLNGDQIAGEIYLNAVKKLPFPDSSFDIVFTEHFIEHLTQDQGSFFLTETYRILKPDGILRQSTPDLEKVIDIYLDQNEHVNRQEAIHRHITTHRKNKSFVLANGCQFLNDIFRLWGHQFIYDKSTLETVTRRSGYIDIKWLSFGTSDFENLKNLETHADVVWMQNGFTMVCEAKKPTAL